MRRGRMGRLSEGKASTKGTYLFLCLARNNAQTPALSPLLCVLFCPTGRTIPFLVCCCYFLPGSSTHARSCWAVRILAYTKRTEYLSRVVQQNIVEAVTERSVVDIRNCWESFRCWCWKSGGSLHALELFAACGSRLYIEAERYRLLWRTVSLGVIHTGLLCHSCVSDSCLFLLRWSFHVRLRGDVVDWARLGRFVAQADI
ncbi:hypothetical protein IQ07DRAFT_128968 [Pyrenochaeta sp. DS3sAY3a]|nr:hypothetical protein IQ07DRAFT_128968 [Pyrenochaeta sp. DS3sAY3a]